SKSENSAIKLLHNRFSLCYQKTYCSHENSHWRASIHLCSVWKEFHIKTSSSSSHESSHWRAPIHMCSVWKEFCR
ncbi:putative gastrula zinc finger protein XlCGF8.2DB-like, partial [Triplophysa rosa]